MKSKGYIVVLVMWLAAGCRQPEVCLRQSDEDYTVKMGDTLRIESCSVNADVHLWGVDGEDINNFLFPPAPFYNHFAPNGGDACSPFVEIIFYDTGRFRLTLDVARLKNGKCSADSYELGKRDITKVFVQVSP